MRPRERGTSELRVVTEVGAGGRRFSGSDDCRARPLIVCDFGLGKHRYTTLLVYIISFSLVSFRFRDFHMV